MDASTSSKAFVDLVDTAYKAAFDQNAWPVFLDSFADALQGHNTALVVQDQVSKQNQAIACVRTDPEQLRRYNDYYWRLNPWIARGSSDLMLGLITVGVGEFYIDRHELLRTEFYNDWLSPQRLQHSIAAVVSNSSERIIICSTLRPSRRGPFTERDRTYYASFLPHLRRAIETRERLADAVNAGRGALELLENSSNACVLLNGALRPVFVNRAARSILSSQGGLSIKNGTLVSARTEDTSRLQKLIARAAATPPSGGEMALFRECGQPLLILVSPVQCRYESPLPPQSVVAVWISDPDRKRLSPVHRIRSLFGLTRAEASVAAELAKGLSLHEIADLLEISRHTARNHLKHILEKTGAHRQADVVRLVLSCPDPFIS